MVKTSDLSSLNVQFKKPGVSAWANKAEGLETTQRKQGIPLVRSSWKASSHCKTTLAD